MSTKTLSAYERSDMLFQVRNMINNALLQDHTLRVISDRTVGRLSDDQLLELASELRLVLSCNVKTAHFQYYGEGGPGIVTIQELVQWRYLRWVRT